MTKTAENAQFIPNSEKELCCEDFSDHFDYISSEILQSAAVIVWCCNLHGNGPKKALKVVCLNAIASKAFMRDSRSLLFSDSSDVYFCFEPSNRPFDSRKGAETHASLFEPPLDGSGAAAP